MDEISRLSEGESSLYILIAEDDILSRLSLAKHLSAGYTVLQAENGYEATILFEQYKTCIAAVITDIQMPKMNGLEFIRWLRTQGSEIPVIAVSGMSDDNIRKSVTEIPNVRWHSKPFRPQEITAVLKQIIKSPV